MQLRNTDRINSEALQIYRCISNLFKTNLNIFANKRAEVYLFLDPYGMITSAAGASIAIAPIRAIGITRRRIVSFQRRPIAIALRNLNKSIIVIMLQIKPGRKL